MNDTIQRPGILHRYNAHLVAFEHTSKTPGPPNKLLFIPGLNEGFLNTPYIPSLASALPSSYSFVELLLSSSYSGWGSSSLTQDVKELGECVAYFRSLQPSGGKIVLMGNSTGCQDVLHYISSEGSRPNVDGGILQAPVSDREGIEMFYLPDEVKRWNEMAQRWVREGRGDEVLPNDASLPLMGARTTANRWLSISSPGPEHKGEDDMFSSDLSDERFRKTFGVVGTKGVALMILYSENDGFVPSTVDKEALVKRMEKAFTEAGGELGKGSGILPGASHTVKEEGKVRQDLLNRVVEFIEDVEKGTL